MKNTVSIRFVRFVCLALLLLFTSFVLATGVVADDSFLNPEVKLTAEDAAAAQDQFGFSVAVKAGSMAIGAPFNDDACATGENCNAGAVYVFTSEGNTWLPNQTSFKLTASDAGIGDQFGWSVAIGGDLLAIGAPSKKEGPPMAGAVYLFRYDGTGWVPDESQTKLTASLPIASERFGFSVALDGNKLVVGAPGSSSAYVFERQQDGKWLSVDLPSPPSASMFGWAVAARNGRVVVGAPASGLAFVLDEGASSWVELPAIAPFLGCALAFHSDTVVVGAPSSLHPFVSAVGSGSVHLFKQQGTTWIEEDVLELPYAGGFGSSVSSNGDVLVVGAPFDEVIHPVSQEAVDNAGSAYVFSYENNEWVMETQLIAGDPLQIDNPNGEPFVDDRFGWAVAADDHTVVAGATFLNDAKLPNNAGAAYAFVLPSDDNNAPTAQAEFRPDEVTEGEVVTLDGSASSDPDGDLLTYYWEQRTVDHEPRVDLDLTDPKMPTFLAPPLNPECATFVFDLTVTDDKGLSSEPYTVEVPVRPNNIIHSTLGRKHPRWWRPSSLWQSYEFKGSAGEKVTITLEKDANGWHRGEKATLILRDKIWGARLWKKEGGRLPSSITATLPADGEYGVYVVRRPWFCRGRGFTGDYVLTVEGTCGKLLK